jgi:hypothetical protein
MVDRPNAKERLAKLLAFSLAPLFVAFISQAASRLHAKAFRDRGGCGTDFAAVPRIFINPVLYEVVAREGDVLQV